MNDRRFILIALGLGALIVYLFANAPPPLPEATTPEATIPVATVLAMAEAENDAVRELWTKAIVGDGQRAGLEFSEDWREDGEQAGPLPALFLRETARNLERSPVRLSLFLGSDAPINPENKFTGLQKDKFTAIRATGAPQFFFTPDTGRHTAMFPDEAVAEACVSCHNEHEDSPRDDWQPDDIMGATTWAYPAENLAPGEVIELLAALRTAMRQSYEAYLDKLATFDNPPPIGERWPADGYVVPTADVFMAELAARSSQASLDALLATTAETSP